MRLAEFDFALPEELIAQIPTERRDASRLMLLKRGSGEIVEARFAGFAECLRQGDLLVLNDTRVIPARLFARKASGGLIEVFLVRRRPGEQEVWKCLVRCSKPPRPGTVIHFVDGTVAEINGRAESETWWVTFPATKDFSCWLERIGNIPLPPYITRMPQDMDRERYQTVFARNPGAVAAPTAGLHLTQELISDIRQRGVSVASVTLHVGLGTFMPVRVENLLEHRMHREEYFIPEATVAAINSCRGNGGRVIAVGTTVVRTLEHAAAEDGYVSPGAGEADIFIYPGYRFKVVDALLTNFHLPKSTLLLLVSAFAGKELLFRAYEQAIASKFRFFSYGDAMFIQ